MKLALLSVPCTICPQCGDDWMSAGTSVVGRPEYCPRCGSPVAGFGFDPLRSRAAVYGNGPLRVNSRAKLIIRFGVLVIGMIGLLTGLSLVYGGWFSTGGMDAIQVWVSRIGGPVLVFQGLVYTWLPFRRPEGGVVLSFAPKRLSL